MGDAIVVPAPEAFDLARASEFASAVIAWSQDIDDVDVLADTAARLAAVELYAAKRAEHQGAEIARAARWVEVRIGSLLPAPQPGRQPRARAREVLDRLGRRQVSDFRRLAEHVERPEVRDAIESGASRRAVLRLCATDVPRGTPERPPLRTTPPTVKVADATDPLGMLAEVTAHYAGRSLDAAEYAALRDALRPLVDYLATQRPTPPEDQTRDPSGCVHAWSAAEVSPSGPRRACKRCGQAQHKVRGRWVDR